MQGMLTLGLTDELCMQYAAWVNRYTEAAGSVGGCMQIYLVTTQRTGLFSHQQRV